MANNHIDFGVDLLPVTDNTYYLGSDSKKWKIIGTLTGNADSATYLKVNDAPTTQSFLLGTSTTPSNTSSTVNTDTLIYLTTTAGELSAKKYSVNNGTTGTEKIRMEWNATDLSLDFIFV